MNLHIYTQQDRSWQQELADVVTDPAELLRIVALDPDLYSEDIQARRLFPMRVPRPFIARMQPGNPEDPLLRQVMPLAEEFAVHPQYSHDPLVEQAQPQQGVLHKYKSRVLLMLRTGCAVNCRYCFRRHFPYEEHHLNAEKMKGAIDYIAANPDINEVILSGGDPLMAQDKHIDKVLTQLEAIPHLRRIRIHTRLPVVIPSRLTKTVIERLQVSRLKAVIVLHINHAQEISPQLSARVQQARAAGIWMLNQAVLLKGVNDHLEAQMDLSESLFAADIVPYYLHVLDKVEGAAHFDLTESEAQALMQDMRAALPGFLVPRLTREEAGQPAKTILG